MTALVGTRLQHALPSPRELGLWAGAALVMLIAHAQIGYAVYSWGGAAPPPPSQPALMMIDLTPMTISAPEAIESETVANETPREVIQPFDTTEIAENAVDPQTIQAPEADTIEPQPTEAVKPEFVPEPEQQIAETVTPEAVPQAIEPEKAEPLDPTPVDPELTAPEVMTAVTPEVVLPLPELRPVVEEKPKQIDKKPEPRKKAETKKVEKKAAAKTPEKRDTTKKQLAKAEAAATPKSTASVKSKGSSSKARSADWRSQIQAWLARHKPRRVPAQGTVNVTFAVNTSGGVSSVRITRSSGNAELDQAALSMVRRASPVPAPDSPQTVTLPLAFVLR